MEAARSFATQDEAKGLFLETAHDNHPAQTLYESLGYRTQHGILLFSADEHRLVPKNARKLLPTRK